MTLDDFPFAPPDSQPNLGAAPARRCLHPKVSRVFVPDAGPIPGQPLSGQITCGRCGAVIDPFRARRGRSARRLGGDTERRIERVYGPRKIGERGDPVDHIGRVWRWQSKATRSLPPLWLAAIAEPRPLEKLPASLEVPYWGMRGHYAELLPVVIRSYVHVGTRTRDWLFVHHGDAANELGLPVPPPPFRWYAVPGGWWLDHFGRDEARP
jgi:hypothetical protein